jgi:hypothetical protein
LCPAIHVLVFQLKKDVDARHKAGHDEEVRIIFEKPFHIFGILLQPTLRRPVV